MASPAELKGAARDPDFELRGNGNAMVSRTFSTDPNDEGILLGAQTHWVVSGEPAHLVLECDGVGGVRLSEQEPRR